MNKKIVIPGAIGVVLLIVLISALAGSCGSKIELTYDEVKTVESVPDSIDLKVYVENSGSMNAYMCPGSNLKEAVYDYVSDLKRNTTSCSLNYINSKIIQRPDDLESFIKNLTPSEFAKAGGNTSDTDLMKIFKMIMQNHEENTVSIFVSDCILDLPQSATDFFGQCQVSLKNTFNEALQKCPTLGVEIICLESKFDGYWYCGKNSKKLTNTNRPYYIWVIGDQHILSMLNKKVPLKDIIGGYKEYCAFCPSKAIPFCIDNKIFRPNRDGIISVEIMANLDETLQLNPIWEIASANPNQVEIVAVREVKAKNNNYSHVIALNIKNPETIHSETLTLSNPSVPSWVHARNDDSGEYVEGMTTGFKHLIEGVAKAYKGYSEFGTISFRLKNK